MAEKGASQDVEHLWEETDGSDVVDDDSVYASEPNLDYLLGSQAQGYDRFDAFDENTWGAVFTPVAPAPWYRSPRARTLLIVSGAALSAIVVSLVLLMFRGPSAEHQQRAPVPSTTAVTTTPLATATSEAPPPPPPPPPPPEPAPVNEGPAVVHPTVRPRATKEPEIGVTRTPATRSPISVAPQQRRPR
ncbi:hypothetical protein A5662_20985 [Mycobacteriaceae bacterium 1482268.1]|nr:hypothetical protein A5662_20985 [Mycobacteriaceae bacterium 1482268.1]